MNFLKKNKWLIFILTISFFLVGIHYLYRAPKPIEEIKVMFKGKSTDFVNLLQKNSLKWNNKPVEISGKVTELVENNFIIDNFIFCQLKETSKLKLLPETNSQITIKGIVIGYDELLNEVKINQCIIKK